MATIETTAKEPAADPTANPEKWIEKWEAGQDAKADARAEAKAEKQAAEPAAQPDTPQPTISWRDVVYGDDAPEFLRGKKVDDGLKSWEHAQRALKDAQQQAAEVKRQLETERREREAELAARKVYQQNQPSQPPPDQYAEIEQKWFDNPRESAAKLRELTLAEAEQIAEKKLQQFRQETQQERQKERFDQWKSEVITTGHAASEAARNALNLDESTWKIRGPAVYLHLTDENSQFYGDGHNVLRTDEIVKTYKAVFGEQSAPVIVKPAPEPQNPPGAKKPAAMQTEAPSTSPLSREEREARKVIAGLAGIDPDKFIKRGERRG